MAEIPTIDLTFEELPGGDLIAKGMRDLERCEIAVESLLVSIAWDSLLRGGLPLTVRLKLDRDAELVLYDLLREEGLGGDAYSKYNSLIRRLVSFQRALGVAVRGAEG